MRDQVSKLKSLGIKAECINSNMTDKEIDEILQNAKSGLYKILYIAPEWLNRKNGWKRVFLTVFQWS